MQIRYFGWSGITIDYDNPRVGFDLFGDAVSPDVLDDASAIVLCATHGHPEHCGSLRSLLRSPAAASRAGNIHLISSPQVIHYINRGGLLPYANAHAVNHMEQVRINDVRITSFFWKHLPLLPPGMSPKIEYAVSLMSHPVDFVRIGLMGLSLPMNAPKLGFHLAFSDGTTVLNYAEGLHRLTDAHEVETIARELPADVLLFAVEPEDAEAIPRWVEILRPSRVYLYEAHRPWRELFGLPYINLVDYAGDLSKRFSRIQFDTLIGSGR
ncbi:MAG: hypothetical protein IT319_11940 [Anaerolineae bacterium]|nr:hypothetical protein [Anaerolineae bacterium]